MTEKNSTNKKRGQIYHAHDRSLKYALKDIRIAKDFFNHYLPEKIKKMVTMETLKLENGSFIDPELKAFYTDILYSVEPSGFSEQALAYIYLHLEHLSDSGLLSHFAWCNIA